MRIIMREGGGTLADRVSGASLRVPVGVEAGLWIPMQAALVSEAAQHVYFATGADASRRNGNDSSTQIIKTGLATLVPEGSIRTLPFYSMTLSADATTIYA